MVEQWCGLEAGRGVLEELDGDEGGARVRQAPDRLLDCRAAPSHHRSRACIQSRRLLILPLQQPPFLIVKDQELPAGLGINRGPRVLALLPLLVKVPPLPACIGRANSSRRRPCPCSCLAGSGAGLPRRARRPRPSRI
jgi:hypothetical protein